MFPKRLDDLECPICGVAFQPKNKWQVTCSMFCMRIWISAMRYAKLKNPQMSRDECAAYITSGGVDLGPLKEKAAQKVGMEEEEVGRTSKKKGLPPGMRRCHGWLDRNGKTHPCSRIIADYRCPACWAKTRANAGCGDWGDGDD